MVITWWCWCLWLERKCFSTELLAIEWWKENDYLIFLRVNFPYTDMEIQCADSTKFHFWCENCRSLQNKKEFLKFWLHYEMIHQNRMIFVSGHHVTKFPGKLNFSYLIYFRYWFRNKCILQQEHDLNGQLQMLTMFIKQALCIKHSRNLIAFPRSIHTCHGVFTTIRGL